MKKKIIMALCLSAVLTFTMCSCSGGDKKEDKQSSADVSKTESSAVQDESSSLPDGMGELLYNSFGSLWSGGTYYIETTMAVEPVSLSSGIKKQESKTEESKTEESKTEESKSEESETEESKTEESKTEETSEESKSEESKSEESSQSESENVMVYNYKIAVDQDKELAMVDIKMPDETYGHLIIKDKKCCKLNDDTKSYMSQDFTENVKAFGEIYTTQLYLGMMNNIKLDSHGKADFESAYNEKEKDLDYEKYILTPDSDSSDAVSKAYITYYFKDGTPYAELLETDLGKTTFIFHKISNKISDDSIFRIPDDYTNAGNQSDESSVESSEEPSEESSEESSEEQDDE